MLSLIEQIRNDIIHEYGSVYTESQLEFMIALVSVGTLFRVSRIYCDTLNDFSKGGHNK